jgi:hypothetical protein
MKKYITLIILLLAFSRSSAQEKVIAEKIPDDALKRVIGNLKLPDGKFKGKLLHITSDKKQALISFTGISVNGEALYKFSTQERGLVLKALFKNNGKQIWIYNTSGAELFNKTGNDRFEGILGTNFSYIDLFLYDLLNFYTVLKREDTIYKKEECYLLELVSDALNPYGSFDIYIKKHDYLPLRVDFHDSKKIIFKSMNIVKTIETYNRKIPVRYDMLDIKQESLTILEYTEFKDIKSYNKEMFRYQNLTKDL